MNPIIELYRGIGAWMVLNSHYGHLLTEGVSVLNFLWTGVYLFFVVTGFLFARNILSKDVEFFPYIIRRLFRIYPLYVVSLVIYYVVSKNDPDKLLYFVKHIFFLNTMTYSKGEAFFFNPVYWSLPTEIEFYMVVPLLAYVRKRMGVTFLLTLFPLFFLVKFLLALAASSTSSRIIWTLSLHLPYTMPEFCVGIILYMVYEHLLSKKATRYSHLLIIFLSGFVLLSLLCTFYALHGDRGLRTYLIAGAFFTTFCALGYALVLLSLLLFYRDKRIRGAKIFLFFGSISYGTYLFHNALPLVTEKLGVSVNKVFTYFAYSLLVLLISFLCFKYIENPMRNLGRRLALGLSRFG